MLPTLTVWGFAIDLGLVLLLAYLLGLGRFFMASAALDTGSAFEGMGAAREVTFACLAEPAFFLGLLVLAAVGWWQLHAQQAGAGNGTDAVRVLAPALFLLAGAALVLRLVAAPLRLAQWWAARSRALVLPLALFEAARRPQATAAALLVEHVARAMDAVHRLSLVHRDLEPENVLTVGGTDDPPEACLPK